MCGVCVVYVWCVCVHVVTILLARMGECYNMAALSVFLVCS